MQAVFSPDRVFSRAGWLKACTFPSKRDRPRRGREDIMWSASAAECNDGWTLTGITSVYTPTGSIKRIHTFLWVEGTVDHNSHDPYKKSMESGVITFRYCPFRALSVLQFSITKEILFRVFELSKDCLSAGWWNQVLLYRNLENIVCLRVTAKQDLSIRSDHFKDRNANSPLH